MSHIHNEMPVYARDVGLDQKIEYDSSNNAIYVGLAFPGASTASAVWQIKKLTYDSSGNMTSLRYADSTDDFTKIWTSRATYNYVDI